MKLNLILGLILIISANSYGLEKKGSKGDEHAKAQHVAHKHHLAVFGGITNNTHANHEDFTLGGEYEFRLPFWNNILATGIVAERVFAEEAETVLSANLIVHPGFDLKLISGPGVVSAKHHGHTETKTFWRFGVAKEFHLLNFSIAPVLCLDIIESQSILVYGITFGKGF